MGLRLIQAAAATSLSVVFVVMLVRQVTSSVRTGPVDASILAAAGVLTISILLSYAPVYMHVDPLLGNMNLADLIARCFLIVGIMFLSRGILRAVGIRRGPIRRALATFGPALAVVLLAIMFLLIDSPFSAPDFMSAFGDQLTAATYSTIEMTYVGAVMTITAVSCFRFAGKMSTRVIRNGFRLLGLGCGLMIVLVILTITMNAAHVLNQMHIVRLLSTPYATVYLASILSLCVGASLPPISRMIRRAQTEAEAKRLMRELEPVWRKVQSDSLAVNPDPQSTRFSATSDPIGRLHRMLVEIEDRLFYENESHRGLTQDEYSLLSRGERLVHPNGPSVVS